MLDGAGPMDLELQRVSIGVLFSQYGSQTKEKKGRGGVIKGL